MSDQLTKDHRVSQDVLETLHSVPIGSYGNRAAKEGYVYKCLMCGKRSEDRYGEQPIDRGFDESCMLNCILVEA